MGAIFAFSGKRLLFCLLVLGTYVNLMADSGAIPYSFEWVRGSDNGGNLSPGHYGTRGVTSPLNHPAGRTGAVTWEDLDGNTWLYSGHDTDPTATPEEAAHQRLTSYSDMWKRDAVSGEWTWVMGPDRPIDEEPVYGMQGVFADGNTPGALSHPVYKFDSITLTSGDGHLWLFHRMKLWKFNPETAQWAWMHSFPTQMNYGQKGVSAPTNSPGLRSGATIWLDEQSGSIYLFGGATSPHGDWNIATDFRTDLWKFSFATGQWTWMHGPNSVSPWANYGTKGVAADTNIPGSRDDTAPWVDASGNLWMFGGNGFDDRVGSYLFQYRGRLNDVWKYDVATNQWTWVSGTKQIDHLGSNGEPGQASADFVPAARHGHSVWKESSGAVWIFGGRSHTGSTILFMVSDLWRYDPAANTWTWVHGPLYTQNKNQYLKPGVTIAQNLPAARADATAWVGDNGQLFMFGGVSTVSTYNRVHSDLWSFNPSVGAWTFHEGAKAVNESASYSPPGVPRLTNDPGSRSMAVTWTDLEGDLWMFSGYTHDTDAGIGTRYMSDLWKYDVDRRSWVFMKGSTVPQNNGNYGTLGVEHPDNLPPVRINAVSWVDGQGRFWMYGGRHINLAFQSWFLSDLWMFNPVTNNWTWVGGTDERNYLGNLDPEGPQDKPSARVGASGWTDAGGNNIYMFGGYVNIYLGNPYNPYFDHYQMNDLWRYNIPTKQWHLVQENDLTTHSIVPPETVGSPGSGYIGGLGQYGIKGQPSASNKPGGRHEAVAFTSPDGKFWLFGGKGYAADSPEQAYLDGGRLNDLWQFDPVNETWTWVSGSDSYDAPSIFATSGEPSPANEPGARWGASGWSHPSGTLLLFGGNQVPAEHTNARWEYQPENNAWAWVDNPAGHTLFGTYNSSHDGQSYPGQRVDAMTWTTQAGEMWLFGGAGYSTWGYGMLNDLWKMSPSRTAASHWELYE